MRARRRAHRRVGDAVGQPRLARRADPAPARVRAAAPRAGAELRPGRGRGRVRAVRVGRGAGRAVRHAVVDGDRLAGRLHQPRRRGVVARAGQARARARRRGDQGRRRRGLLHPRRRPARRRADRRARRRGRSAACTGVSMQRALDEVHPGSGVLFGRSGWTGQHAIGHDLGRRPGVGLLVAARARGRDAERPRAAASRTGRTTSAATSATGSSSAARRSCSSAGSSSAASRR